MAFTRQNWLTAPTNRQSFQNLQSLFPTARLKRGSREVSPLPEEFRDIGSITYGGLDGSQRTVNKMLAETYTDAFLVIKDGKLICEHYENGMQRDSFHLLNSVSKTFLGMLAGIYVEEGKLDLNERVSTYMPALVGTAFDATTVQHALDMTGAVKFSEKYAQPEDDFWVETATVGWRPDLAEQAGSSSLKAYAESRLESEQKDGEAFHYRTLLTNIVAMALEGATGHPVHELMQERIWKRLGAEQDANVVLDSEGFPYFGAGMSACARDLGRFGQVLLNDGLHQGEQILPAQWVQATRMGSEHHRAHFAQTEYALAFPDGHYQNQTWASRDEEQLVCIGIFGQTIYTSQKANLVIVKLSTHPEPENSMLFADAFLAMTALTDTL